MTPFKRKRLAAGLTTQALGEKVGVSHVTVQRWERGDNIPEAKYFPLLAAAFEMTPEEVTYLFAPNPSQAAPAA